jgi:hypothetical protein
MSTPPSQSSTAPSSGPLPDQPLPSALFLSDFMPTLIVLLYVFAGLYFLVSRLPGGPTSSVRQCTANFCSRVIQNVKCLIRARTNLEYIPSRTIRRALGRQDDVEEQGMALLELLGLSDSSVHLNGQIDYYDENNDASPGHITSSSPHQPRVRRSRRKRPAPLSLNATPGSVTPPSVSIDLAIYFDPHTGLLKDQSILHPTTGLEGLCALVQPPPSHLGNQSERPTHVSYWLDRLVDKGVKWMLQWLEASGSGKGGAGDYHRVPKNEVGGHCYTRSGSVSEMEL